MLTSLILLTTLAWPRSMTISAGGFSLESRQVTNACWRDPRSGVYALKTMECDGAHRSITVTKDRRVVASSGYNLARFGKPNPEGYSNEVESRTVKASTAHGVAFGASRTSVVRKLGSPFKTVTRGSKGEFRCDLYKRVVMDSREDGQVLRNTYVYKNGKLIEILLNLDAIPGCGDDSRSDEGWPWTKF
jgi:hypothetical protein